MTTPVYPGAPEAPTLPLAKVAALHPDLAAVLAELLPTERPVPLSEWASTVTARYAGRKKNTRVRMTQALAELLALAGPGAMTTALDAELVARFAARVGAASTTNGLLSSLRTACRLALKRRWLLPSRLEGAVWRVRETAPRPKRHHGRADVVAVLDWLAERSGSWDGGRLHALAALYAYTGVRLQEGLGLRKEHVDLNAGFLFIHPNGQPLKTDGSLAPVPCPMALRSILRRWLRRCRSEWVFPNVGRTGPWTGGTAGRRPTDRLVAAGLECGVAGFTPLSLRHSLATHLAGHWGLSARQIQQVLRHSSEATQLIYLHPDTINLGEAVAGFDYRAPRRAREKNPAKASPAPGHKAFPRRKSRRPS